jgi:hypothetical protein
VIEPETIASEQDNDLRELLDSTKSISDFNVRSEILGAAAAMFVRRGKTETGMRTMHFLDDDDRSFLLWRTGDALVENGQLATARYVAGELSQIALNTEEQFARSARSSMAAQLNSKTGLFSQARIASRSCVGTDKVYAFSSILVEYYKSRNPHFRHRYEELESRGYSHYFY